MNAIKGAVSELFDMMGLGRKGLSNRGRAVIDIAGSGQLHLEEAGETLVVYLARPIEVGTDKLALQKQVLEQVHFERLHPFPVQAAMHDGALVFVTRLEATEVDVPTLEHAVEMLTSLHSLART